MSQLIVSEALSLDGVFEDPANSPGATFEFAGWTTPYQSAEQNAYFAQGMGSSRALLLGRLTYEHLRAGWEQQTGPAADFMNTVPKYVVSTTLKQAAWQNTTLISGEAAGAVAQLKQGGQRLALLGSGLLAHTLRAADLIDEYSLLIYPLVLGRGRRFFDGGEQSRLKLTNSQAFSSGVVLMTYAPDRQ